MKFHTDIHGIQRINPTDFDFSLRTTVRLKFVFVTQISSQLWDGLLIFCSNIHGPQRIHPTHLGHFLTFPVAPLTGCFCFTMKCLNNFGIAIYFPRDKYSPDVSFSASVLDIFVFIETRQLLDGLPWIF